MLNWQNKEKTEWLCRVVKSLASGASCPGCGTLGKCRSLSVPQASFWKMELIIAISRGKDYMSDYVARL